MRVSGEEACSQQLPVRVGEQVLIFAARTYASSHENAAGSPSNRSIGGLARRTAATMPHFPSWKPQHLPRPPPAPGFYQQRVALLRLLGELYNYRLVDSKLIFSTLHLLLAFGYDPATPPEQTRWAGCVRMDSGQGWCCVWWGGGPP